MVNVSIIIPVYNVEQYIESCLYSVINQTYKGTLECIIVNDCTPDQSMEVVNRLLSVYQGNILFKIINHQENKGLSAARNSGVKIAKGDYLYFNPTRRGLGKFGQYPYIPDCQNLSINELKNLWNFCKKSFNKKRNVSKRNHHYWQWEKC